MTAAGGAALFQFRQDLEYLVVGDQAARVRDPGVADDTRFIDHKPGTFRPQIAGDSLRILRHGRIVVEHPVGARRFPAHVGQQRIRETDYLAPCLVGVVEINTDAQNLGIRGLELGKIQLEGQRFLRSGVGERANVEEQHHMPFTRKIGQPDWLAGG